MSDRDPQRDLRDLLTDAVSDVEPRHALADIQARVRPSASRRWTWAVGGAVVGIAATVAALALVDGGPVREAFDPDPAGSPTVSETSSPSPTETATSSEPDPSASPSATGEVPTVAVYYIGDTPRGPRLFREFNNAGPAADPLDPAMELLQSEPIDPDYRTAWPQGAIVATAFDGVGADGLIQVTLADPSSAQLPEGMTPAEGRLAVEQVVYTLQAAVEARAPVQFYVGTNPVNEVYGVPTSEPIVQSPALEVLALASISDPGEGTIVDNDEPLKVRGVGNSYEATMVWTITRDGTNEELATGSFTAGWEEQRLYPFEGEIDVSDLEPGTYTLSVATADPSGGAEGPGPDVDDRTITVVD